MAFAVFELSGQWFRDAHKIARYEAVRNIIESADKESVSEEGGRAVFHSSGKGQTSTVTEEYSPLS